MDKKEVIVGLILLVYSILALLSSYIKVPYLFATETMLLVIILAGLYFLKQSLTKKPLFRSIKIISSLILMALGLFPLIIRLRVLTLDFIPLLKFPDYYFAVILLIYSLYLLYENFFIN